MCWCVLDLEKWRNCVLLKLSTKFQTNSFILTLIVKTNDPISVGFITVLSYAGEEAFWSLVQFYRNCHISSEIRHHVVHKAVFLVIIKGTN